MTRTAPLVLLRQDQRGILLCNASCVNDTEMMQRVIAILTQAREVADLYQADDESDELSPQAEMMGELIVEALQPGAVTTTSPRPQDVADAVIAAMQPRVGLLVACFTAAFTHIAHRYDEAVGEGSSAEALRQFVINWELDDGS